ncbi:MAG: spermidine/putrescine ABC transporter substrate-binding protein [Clostridia bacterium]|nr:spermidine/putrescine ABC transporter substrate-binding protein [Clostridia bacterium]
MKKFAAVLFAFITVAMIPAHLVHASAAVDPETLRGTTLNVYNWGEYISDGSEGALDVNKEFEDRYGIHVEYTNYTSNEDLYAKISGGGASYDLICPSDYMVERMIAEDMLEKIDFSNIPNYKYIPEEYKNLYYDPNNEYSVPYTYGVMGIIYNSKMVDGEPDSWSILWDEKYADKILNFNNPRDAFSTAQFLLGLDVNSENAEDWQKAADKLKEQKPLVQSYVMDEIYNKMENGEAAIAPYYVGDYVMMAQNNPDLRFFYPKEGTNVFVDALCIPKNAQNKAAAELYINFMLETYIATANAEFVIYGWPHTGVLENPDYIYKDNEYLYGTVPVKTEFFHNLSPETLALMTNLWDDLKIEGSKSAGVYIALIVVVVAIAAIAVFGVIRKKRRESQD